MFSTSLHKEKEGPPSHELGQTFSFSPFPSCHVRCSVITFLQDTRKFQIVGPLGSSRIVKIIYLLFESKYLCLKFAPTSDLVSSTFFILVSLPSLHSKDSNSSILHLLTSLVDRPYPMPPMVSYLAHSFNSNFFFS